MGKEVTGLNTNMSDSIYSGSNMKKIAASLVVPFWTDEDTTKWLNILKWPAIGLVGFMAYKKFKKK